VFPLRLLAVFPLRLLAVFPLRLFALRLFLLSTGATTR
jgi:hypothetical protein